MTIRIRNPKSKRRLVTIEFPKPEAKLIRKRAHRDGVSVGSEIRRLVFVGMALR